MKSGRNDDSVIGRVNILIQTSGEIVPKIAAISIFSIFSIFSSFRSSSWQ
jgi:LytS/YehU family sensor histidine kinase